MKRLSVKNIWKMSLVAAVAMGATTLPSSALEPEDKPAIEKIVRDYLLSNPEIILEVQQALQTKQETEAKERAAIALTQNSDVIFNSKNQGVIGNKSGDVTVVEFFDYNCGFCQRAMNDMNVLLKGDNNLKFVMKELPILSAGSPGF